MPDHLIRDLRLEDTAAWEELWALYLVHYRTTLPMERTAFLWDRLFDEADPVAGIVAEVDGAVVGLAHYFPHPDTWEEAPVCYLEDLVVAESHRRSGIGRSLILEVHRRCRANGWRRLYWLTEADNTVARIVYDGLTGGTSGFVAYEMEIPPPEV